MLGFRRKLNEYPELVRLIRNRFVAVAVDHEVERRKDGEGVLYRKVAAGRVSNCVFAFDPSGNLFFERIGDDIYKKFAPALEAALNDFRPAKAFKAPESDVAAKRDEHSYPVPLGVTVVHVTSKAVAGDQGWPGSKVWGRDNLWIRADEARALVKGVLPQSLKTRIARCHLINTTGLHLHAKNMWRPENIKRLELHLADGRITGSVHLQVNAKRYYQAKLSGVVESSENHLTRFEMVAVGEACSDRSDGVYGLPQGNGKPFTLAVAFRLMTAEDSPSLARTPPAALHHGRGAAYEDYMR